MIIFHRKGKRISFREKVCLMYGLIYSSIHHFPPQLRYDPRVIVTFQDEVLMLQVINQLWKPACSEKMLLVPDVHKAQKTDAASAV